MGAIIAKGRPQARTVAFVAAAASLAHLLAGRWDWFSRYGIYIMATAFAGLLIVWGPIIGTQARHITTPSLLIFVLPFVGYTYLIDTLVTPPPRVAKHLRSTISDASLRGRVFPRTGCRYWPLLDDLPQ